MKNDEMRKNRNTPQRQLVKKIIDESCDHPTADTVYKRVIEHDPRVSLGTVYRNLNMLSDDGTIQKISVGGADHFDGNAKNHYHMLCTECKRLIDVAYPVIEDIEQKAVDFVDGKITSHTITFIGVCSGCLH